MFSPCPNGFVIDRRDPCVYIAVTWLDIMTGVNILVPTK